MEEKVLIVSTEKNRAGLIQLVRECGFPSPSVAGCGGDARRLMLETPYALILINAPLPDEFGADLALGAARGQDAGVVLVVRNEQADEVSAWVESGGVFVVEKPVSRQMFHRALKLVEAARHRMWALREENARLRLKLEELRLVGRAKCLLIERRGMTEQGAHRYIEKTAMDLRETRRDVAQDILREENAEEGAER